ncbi:MAG TPA: DUF2127 domain-containing protein [Acidobacteriaceae bacterium]|nr:DUF2127 domain-containing protein [Acidobacteriaceae bacterium]
MNTSHSGLLRLIAVFKLLKAIILIAVGVGALKLFHSDPAGTLSHWIARLGLDPGAHFLDQALSKVASIPPDNLKDLGLGSFLYAALFLIEGTGLWLRKHWAEWFTVIITSSLVPLEIYEIHHHPTASKVLVLLINLAVVVYLVLHIRKERTSSGQPGHPQQAAA